MIFILIFFIFLFYINLINKKELFGNDIKFNYKKGDKLQYFYLIQALNEVLERFPLKNKLTIVKNTKINIDHINGINYVNYYKFPIIFPLYLKNFVSTIDKTKKYDYNFIGNITEKRKWIKKYKNNNSIIKKSLNGRKNFLKYNIDKNYLKTLCKSKFTLSPTGDCPWSYRFFEAIMCLSIPILEKNSNDIYCKDYFFFYDDDKHFYDLEKAKKNYNLFIKNHFINNNIFL